MALNSKDTFDWTNLLGKIRQFDETFLVTNKKKKKEQKNH